MKEEKAKWKAVLGKCPSKQELAGWTEKQWITFLQFVLIFMKTDKKGKTMFSVSRSKWFEVDDFLNMPDHPFQEFLFRINQFVEDKGTSERKFYYKLAAMTRTLLGYLRNNPTVISEEMKKIIEPNEKLNWCLSQTKVETTEMGIDVVVPNKLETITKTQQGVAPYEKQLIDAMIGTTNLLNRLLKSIKIEDIKDMETKDKIMAIGRMSWVFSVGKNMKPNRNIFQQINIHTASRDDLERDLLNFNKDE